MPVADFAPPGRLMAGGGPSTPDQRVLRALTTPLIGQFDPAFTALMDDVTHLARGALLTANARCFPVSGLASAGLEALLNSLIGEGDRVVVHGPPAVSDIVRRCGGVSADSGRLTIVTHVDPSTSEVAPLAELAARCHALGSAVIVDATLSLGGCELRTDAWGLDAVCAGVDRCLGAPSGMALVTYTDALEGVMSARAAPPRTSYLDLLQLQAYWSAARLNHHTAPTSLVYGLREALRLVHEEGLEERWARHERVAQALRSGLAALGLQPSGGPLLSTVRVPGDASALRARLLDDYGVAVREAHGGLLCLGLLGADARPDACRTVLAALSGALGG
jgi:aspartate aminotransferase-like enzyme